MLKMGYLLDKWDFLYYLYSVIKKTKAMYTVIVNAKTTEGKKIILRQTLKTKKACELFVEGARELVKVVDYSITKTK